MTIIRIFLGQLNTLWRDPAANLEKLRGLLNPLAGGDDALLVLPEMMSTGFTDDLEVLAEMPGGPWEQAFHQLIREKSLPALVGLVRRHGEQLFNETIFMHPSESEAQVAYRKIRPFKSEHKVVTPGSEVITFEFRGAVVCPLICYDLRFPELFRAGLRQGAEVFVVMASWPDPRHHHWECLLKARAIENQAYVIGVNRCGDDPNAHHAGGSVVIDPHGVVVDHAGETESIREVEIDVQEVRDWRAAFPPVTDYLRKPQLA